jgi:hypothetical protein
LDPVPQAAVKSDKASYFSNSSLFTRLVTPVTSILSKKKPS